MEPGDVTRSVIQRTQELVLQARAGDEAALDQLYALYAERVQWMVRLRLGGELRSQLDSMDVVQDAMMNAFRGLGRFTYKKEGDTRKPPGIVFRGPHLVFWEVAASTCARCLPRPYISYPDLSEIPHLGSLVTAALVHRLTVCG